MSVYTQEYQSEEFPGFAPAFRDAAPSLKPRTNPLCLAVTGDESVSKTLQYAASAFAAVAIDDSNGVQISVAAPTPAVAAAPQDAYYTMEDGGQSHGASITSALAAKLLAEVSCTCAPVGVVEEDEDDPVVMAREITKRLQAATGLDRYRKLCLTPGGC